MYETAFDLAEVGFRQWQVGGAGVVFIIAGVLLLLLRKRIFASRPALQRSWLPIIILGFGVLWTGGALAVTWSDYHELRSAFDHGECAVVQGTVTEFSSMPVEGGGVESFVVAGQRFEYSDFRITAGFNHTATMGGPMAEGLVVRITHLDGRIAKLEIRM